MLDTHLYRHEEILITLLPGFRALNTKSGFTIYIYQDLLNSLDLSIFYGVGVEVR